MDLSLDTVLGGGEEGGRKKGRRKEGGGREDGGGGRGREGKLSHLHLPLQPLPERQDEKGRGRQITLAHAGRRH